MTSLVEEKSAENNFAIECAFCGHSAIDNSLKSDVREVHKYENKIELKNKKF